MKDEEEDNIIPNEDENNESLEVTANENEEGFDDIVAFGGIIFMKIMKTPKTRLPK